MIAGLFALTALSFQATAQCQAGFTLTVNTNTVTFTNTSTGGGQPTYYWSFGDGNYDWQANPVHVYPANGSYTVCLTLYDSLNFGCQSTICDSLFIYNAPNPPCNAGFTFYSDSANQNGTQFYDQSSYNPTSWSWTFGDGGTSTIQNPVHQYANAGNYIACLTIVDAFGNTCSHCDTVTYYPCTLNASFTSNTANDPQISFTNTSTGGYAPYYYWDFGDGGNAWANNATHTYQNSGTYNVCITAWDSLNGCSDTYCSTIVIVNAPAQPCLAQFYAYPDTNNTFPGTIYFYDYSTGGPTSWSWNFGDGNTSTQQHPTHQYAQPGSYVACLTITTPAGTCTACDTVVVGNFNPGPCSVSLLMVQDSFNLLLWHVWPLVGGTAPFTYSWHFGDGNTSNLAYPTHNYAQPGHYLICQIITDANNCSSTTCDSTYKLFPQGGNMQYLVVESSAAGISENSISEISVFPNPANDVIEVSFPEWEKGTLTITDMTGREVHAQSMNANNTKVNLADVPAGCYTLSIKTETRTGHSRIMVVR